MKKLFLAMVLSLFLIASSSVEAGSRYDSHKHERTAKAVFALYATIEDQTHFVCTAEAIGKTADGYLLLTAGHCLLELSDELEVSPNDVSFSVDEEIRVTPVLKPVKVLAAAENEKYDAMLLDFPTQEKFETLELGDESKEVIGNSVFDVNFSDGLTKQLSVGRIASNVMNANADEGKCDLCNGLYIVQIFGGPGASGSAIVSEKTGKVVGILIGGTSETLGVFALPVSQIKQFIRDAAAEYARQDRLASVKQI